MSNRYFGTIPGTHVAYKRNIQDRVRTFRRCCTIPRPPVAEQVDRLCLVPYSMAVLYQHPALRRSKIETTAQQVNALRLIPAQPRLPNNLQGTYMTVTAVVASCCDKNRKGSSTSPTHRKRYYRSPAPATTEGETKRAFKRNQAKRRKKKKRLKTDDGGRNLSISFASQLRCLFGW